MDPCDDWGKCNINQWRYQMKEEIMNSIVIQLLKIIYETSNPDDMTQEMRSQLMLAQSIVDPSLK